MEASKCHSYLQDRQAGGSGELQASQIHLSPWEASGVGPSGNQFQTREGQEHNQKQSAQVCEGENHT